MTPHEVSRLEDQGTAFGEAMLTALNLHADACGTGGRGMSWSEMAELFEETMDRFTDSACERMYSDEASDLYLAACRLAFYGLHASTADRLKWRRQVGAARSELTKEAA